MLLAYSLAYEKARTMMKNGVKTGEPIRYPLRVQAIRSRGQAPRMYGSFPLAIAAAIGLEPEDEVQWELLDRGELHLVRLQPT